MIVSYEFLQFLHYLCFRGWGIHFWYSYWATTFRWPQKSRSTSGTGGTWRYCWLCLINFWNFLHYLCFRGREIYFWYSYSGTMFGCPQKFRSTSGTGGTDDSVLWIFEISSVVMFSRSRNPLLTFLLSCHARVTSKIQVNFRFRRFLEVLMIVSHGIS